ncbi:MAG: hypothetical protein ACOC5A_04935 [Halanaerobiales bacterium]
MKSKLQEVLEKWEVMRKFNNILHQGEMVVYIRALDFEFPASWEMWGL